MVPKIGLSTNPLADPVKELENIGKLGMEFAEITIEDPLATPRYLLMQKKGIKKAAKEHGLFLTGHAAWWIELGSTHESIRRSWIKEGKEMLDCCGELGVTTLNFHIHAQGTAFLKNRQARKRVLDNHVKSLRELVAYGRKYKVQILLENIPVKDKFSVKDMKYVLDRVPGMGMTLDVAHAFVEGGTKAIMDYIKTVKGRILHAHLCDNNGRIDQHLPIGEGKIPWKRVVRALKGIGYDRAIVMEIFHSSNRALKDSRKRILRLWKGQK